MHVSELRRGSWSFLCNTEMGDIQQNRIAKLGGIKEIQEVRVHDLISAGTW